MANHDPTAITNGSAAAAEVTRRDDGARKTIFASGGVVGDVATRQFAHVAPSS